MVRRVIAALAISVALLSAHAPAAYASTGDGSCPEILGWKVCL